MAKRRGETPGEMEAVVKLTLGCGFLAEPAALQPRADAARRKA